MSELTADIIKGLDEKVLENKEKVKSLVKEYLPNTPLLTNKDLLLAVHFLLIDVKDKEFAKRLDEIFTTYLNWVAVALEVAQFVYDAAKDTTDFLLGKDKKDKTQIENMRADYYRQQKEKQIKSANQSNNVVKIVAALGGLVVISGIIYLIIKD